MSRANDERLIWFDGQIVPVSQAKVGVLSPTSQFGANVFEGIRCYWSERHGRLYAFRLDCHLTRLRNSMKLFRMEEQVSASRMKECFFAAVRANGYREDIAVRQTVFIDGSGSWSSTGPVNMFVAPIPKPRGEDLSRRRLKCGISSWRRISDLNLSPRVKVGANYMNSRVAQLEAAAHGYDSAIFLNDGGKIAEGPGSCLMMVRDGTLITPPLSASILEGITRSTVIDLARDVLRIPVVERDIDRTELYVADEVFFCGSAVEIAPIVSVDGFAIGSASEGPITQRIAAAYFEVVSGDMPRYARWLTSVYG